MRCLAQVRVDTTRSFVQFRPVDLGRWKAIVSGQLTEARNNPDGVRLLFIDSGYNYSIGPPITTTPVNDKRVDFAYRRRYVERQGPTF